MILTDQIIKIFNHLRITHNLYTILFLKALLVILFSNVRRIILSDMYDYLYLGGQLLGPGEG